MMITPPGTNVTALDGLVWRKSSRSANNQGQCVEVGSLIDHSGRIAVRDTKDRQGPTLTTAAPEWDAFVAGVRGGKFDF